MEPSNGDPAAREAPYRSSLQPRFARAFTSPAERPHAAAAPPDDDCATLARPAPLWERVAEMFAAPPNRARAGAPSMTSDWERVLPLRQTITPYAAPGPRWSAFGMLYDSIPIRHGPSCRCGVQPDLEVRMPRDFVHLRMMPHTFLPVEPRPQAPAEPPPRRKAPAQARPAPLPRNPPRRAARPRYGNQRGARR